MRRNVSDTAQQSHVFSICAAEQDVIAGGQYD